jgi:VanZ family protein
MTKKTILHFLYYWFPVFVFCAVLFLQSSFSAPEAMPTVTHMDKLLHLGAYSILGALFLRALVHSKYQDRAWLIRLASILLAGIYGATDEWHQYYVPSRSADPWDLLCDFLGGVVGVSIYHILVKKHPRLRTI